MMTQNYSLVVLLCTIVALHLVPTDARKGADQKLWESFGRTADQASFRPKQRINASVTITLESLSSFEPDTASLAIGYYIQMHWIDPTISWNKQNFDVDLLSVPSKMVWLPDIVPYTVEEHEKVFDQNVVIKPDGSMTNVPYYRTRVTCAKVKGFGCRRECKIKFGSWTLSGLMLNVTASAKRPDTSYASFTGLKRSGWSFVEGKIQNTTKYYPCCPDPYMDVTMTLTIRRGARKGEGEEEENEEEEEEEEERKGCRKQRPRRRRCRRRREDEEEEERC